MTEPETDAVFERLVRDNLGTDEVIAVAKTMHGKLPDCDSGELHYCASCEVAAAQASALAQKIVGRL